MVGGGASVLLQMAQKVGEESLVLCSEWVKTGIEYKTSLGGGGCCKLRGLPRRGEGKTKSFDSSLKNCAIIQGFADRSEVCKISKILV